MFKFRYGNWWFLIFGIIKNKNTKVLIEMSCVDDDWKRLESRTRSRTWQISFQFQITFQIRNVFTGSWSSGWSCSWLAILTEKCSNFTGMFLPVSNLDLQCGSSGWSCVFELQFWRVGLTVNDGLHFGGVKSEHSLCIVGSECGVGANRT